ncbi:HEPN domain-containing protein [Pseudoalteromonas sp. S2893]|uniref:HEPN domain-containing protein n=1 Tax=Pseudoalteromonas sp. S2893 TaxID=579530 RepID=UPI00110BD762|nr:HEPN domain-containing protein [Pseudoalteromonas sp. S2893]TMP15464.1 hypothetical protein CWC04_14160 [Pseudoalteromonas sp. S2893]
MKSLECLQRGLNHDDPMDCLSNCWMGFNNLYSAHQSNSEIQAIKQFIDANVDVGTAQKLIDNHQTEITYFMSRPIIDMRGNGRNSQRDIDSYNSSDCPLAKLKSILMFIYQVRCNLMHGQKSPSRDRDVELCKHSWPFVAELVDKYA